MRPLVPSRHRRVPADFLMSRDMLRGVEERAEALASTSPAEASRSALTYMTMSMAALVRSEPRIG